MTRRAETDTTLDGAFEGARPAPSHTLARLTRCAAETDSLRERDLEVGDWVLVRTRNSLYVLGFLGGGAYQASGGWFDKQGSGPAVVRVNGCTWGGHAILTGMVAAPGMFIEFDNGLGTTRIQEVRLLRGATATVH
jgi:hypothetical protein